MPALLLEYECVGCSRKNQDEQKCLNFFLYLFENRSIPIKSKLNRILSQAVAMPRSSRIRFIRNDNEN